MENELTLAEVLQLSEKMYATTKDVMKIGSIGEAKALKIKNDIKRSLELDGYVLPRNRVIMSEVFKYFKVDIQQLKKIMEVTNGKRNNTN